MSAPGSIYPQLASEKCSLRALFKSPVKVAENQWTLVGNPPLIPGGGISLDGATQYCHRPVVHEFNSPSITFAFWFTPNFDHSDDVNPYFCDCTNGSRYMISKRPASGNNELRINLGNTNIADIPEATYSPYWKTGERNLLVVSSVSGNTNAWLSGNQILTGDATAWTPKQPAQLWVGAAFSGAGFLDGIIHSFEIFQEAWDGVQEAAFRNNSTFAALGQADCLLNMRSQILAPDTKNILVDGDMELADTSAWTLLTGAMSKETGNPHGGLRVLRLTDSGAWALAAQSILTATRTYNVRGYARSDGVGIPMVIIGAGGNPPDWAGTLSTGWQPFDVTGVSDGVMLAVGTATLSGYVEFDDVSVHDMTDLQQTPDRSGSGRDFLLGDGVTPAKFPAFQHPGFLLTGTEYLYRGSGDIFGSPEQTIVMCVAPDDPWDDPDYIHWLDTTAGNRYAFIKRPLAGAHKFLVLAGGTTTLDIAAANWSPYWRLKEKNVIIAAITSGNNKLWLNEVLVGSSTTAWTPTTPAATVLGMHYNLSVNPFKGVYHAFYSFPFLFSATQAREISARLTSGAA